jgi:lipid A 3-O-deacylase
MQKTHRIYRPYGKQRCFLILCLFALMLVASKAALAWSHELSFGYAIPYTEADEIYSHSGAYLNGSFYSWQCADRSLLFTLNAAGGYWTASSEINNRLVTFALQPTVRVYFSHNMMRYIRPYLFIAYGPAYLSHKKFASREQGENFAFQGDIGAGFELGRNYSGIDVNIRMIHYSNAGLFTPNQGFELYVVSIGKLF